MTDPKDTPDTAQDKAQHAAQDDARHGDAATDKAAQARKDETASPEARDAERPSEGSPPRSSRMANLRQEIDRLFDDFGWPESWSGFGLGGDRDRSPGAAWRTLMRGTAPAMDLVERDAEYELQAELPGLSARDVEVTVSDGRLVIRGEKTAERREERENLHLAERSYGSFQRAFRLPGGIDADRIEATFENGVLRLRLPKTADARHGERRIDIRGG
jgi:HSP20 family protein